MTWLTLTSIGNLQVTLAQQPINRFRATKVQRLLAYLALSAPASAAPDGWAAK